MVVGVTAGAGACAGALVAIGEAVLALTSGVVRVGASLAHVNTVGEDPIDKDLVVSLHAVMAGSVGAVPTELHRAVSAG